MNESLDTLALICLIVVALGVLALFLTFREGASVSRTDLIREEPESDEIALRALDLAHRAIDAVNEARADSNATARLAMGYVNDARVDQNKFISSFMNELNAGVRLVESDHRLYRLDKERERLGVPQYVATALDSPRLPASKRLTEEQANQFISDQKRLLGSGVVEGQIVRWID